MGRENPTWKTAAGINGGFWDEPGWTHLECEGGIKALQELSWKLQVVCPGKMGMGKAGGIPARNSLGKKKNTWSKQRLEGGDVGSEGIVMDRWEKELLLGFLGISALDQLSPRSRG